MQDNNSSKESISSSDRQIRSRFASAQSIARIKRHDKIAKTLFTAAGILSGLMIVLIFIFVFGRGIQVFLPSYGEHQQNLWQFLTGMKWMAESNPSESVYGIGYIIINTIGSAFFAALISFPLAVLTALMITRMAPKKLSTMLTTAVEVLAAIPSVVYGVFASGVITKLVVKFAGLFDYFPGAAGNSFMAVVLLLAIMIFPTMTDLAIAAIHAVPDTLIQGSLALGATPTQTNFKMVLRAARSGIFSGLVMGVGRAFGEATAVSMVAGNSYIPSRTIFDGTRTLTSTMLQGLHETQGLDYDIRFSVGIVLMFLILLSNAGIYFLKRKFAGGMQDE